MSIRIRPLDGQWEVLGADRWRGIVPENIVAESDAWGPSTLSFRMAASGGSSRPDLLPYTPVEFLVESKLVWSGFVWERPSEQNGFSVTCRGWQFHLDDDQYDRVYVQTRLSEWIDARDHPDTIRDRSEYNADGSVDLGTEDGISCLALTWPTDTLLYYNSRCGVILDLGPDSTAKRVVVTFEASGHTSNITFYALGLDSGPFGSTETGDEELFQWDNVNGGEETQSGTFVTSKRYLEFFMRSTNAANYYTADDIWFLFTAIKVFRSTAYESGDASILKADQVIKDALTFAPLLNQSVALITAGSVVTPEYKTGGYKTPREVMAAINGWEGKRLKVAGEDLKTLVYDAFPTAPQFKVGDWSGASFSDASASGEDIFDRVIVDGTSADGLPVHVTRTQTGTLVDRRGFHRTATLSVSSTITTAQANALGDLWLADHSKTPFSGTLNVTGSSLRYIQGGANVPPHLMLLQAGEKIALDNRVDPDTGASSRIGRIVGVRYAHATKALTIELDDRRSSFQQLLERYGLEAPS